MRHARLRAAASGEVSWDIAEAELHGDEHAVVPVLLTGPDGAQAFEFELDQASGAWLVSDYHPEA